MRRTFGKSYEDYVTKNLVNQKRIFEKYFSKSKQQKFINVFSKNIIEI
jgi:hypothetical protein